MSVVTEESLALIAPVSVAWAAGSRRGVRNSPAAEPAVLVHRVLSPNPGATCVQPPEIGASESSQFRYAYKTLIAFWVFLCFIGLFYWWHDVPKLVAWFAYVSPIASAVIAAGPSLIWPKPRKPTDTEVVCGIAFLALGAACQFLAERLPSSCLEMTPVYFDLFLRFGAAITVSLVFGLWFLMKWESGTNPLRRLLWPVLPTILVATVVVAAIIENYSKDISICKAPDVHTAAKK